MIASFAAVSALCLAYWFPIRRWSRQWGKTKVDRSRLMRGDAEIEDPTYSATVAVTINARPAHVWPSLVQMGYQREGLDSYD